MSPNCLYPKAVARFAGSPGIQGCLGEIMRRSCGPKQVFRLALRPVWVSAWLFLAIAVLSTETRVQATVFEQAAQDRKLRTGMPPEYPDLARRMNIRGVAQVEATVAPDESVTQVKELGGNPVLLDALRRAVKKWKYEPAKTTSIVNVKYDFSP